ncbi:MAG TPA: relaxation protein [Rhodanobacter sp.]|jgi:ABC-type transporter Mla subunit MlaD|nr:relaxation protein [Rhodanobacter sp.]
MQQDELTALIDKTATLMAQYQRRGAAIEARLQTLSDALHGLTQQLPVALKTSAAGVLQTLPAEMRSVMRDGLGQSISDYRQRLDVAAHDVEKASQALLGQLGSLQRLHRQLIWKTMGAVALALTLLLAGGAWLSLQYTRVIRDNQISADLLKAYNGADVTLCRSGGTLCANVDPHAARYGERRQYLPVKSR